MWSDLKPIDLKKIQMLDFPEDQYYPVETPKKQIVLHHTVSNPFDTSGVLRTWIDDPAHVATHFVITGDGTPYQLYSSKYWAHHLGVVNPIFISQGLDPSGRNLKLNQESIGIEICNWGFLNKTSDGKYKAVYGNIVNNVEIQEYPDLFRGQRYYQKYTEAQIKTVGELLLFFKNKFNIPLDYHADMWDINKNALLGTPGVWTHVSYHPEKSDLHPQPEMVEMLKTLKGIS